MTHFLILANYHLKYVKFSLHIIQLYFLFCTKI